MNEELLKGSKKIMFSAPHSAPHFRNGKVKVREINTDFIVKELNKRKDVPVIYKIKSENEDANWDKKSTYKQICKDYVLQNDIHFFIDIHGMDYNRKEDICIGTANGKNLKDYDEIITKLKSVFNEFGYTNIGIDRPFSADNIRCVSTYISQECSIDAVQIEINNKYRFSECDEYDLENLIKCFEKIVDIL